jgi:hypothetical protein
VFTERACVPRLREAETHAWKGLGQVVGSPISGYSFQMKFSRSLPSSLLALTFALGTACEGGGGASAVDDDQGLPTGGDGNLNSGGSPSTLECKVDADCVAVGDTEAPCYSPGCSPPIAASREAASANPCLVEWTGSEGPAIPEGCVYSEDDPVACPALCAQAPACIVPRCDAGHCMLVTSSQPSDCVTGGGAGSCDDLNSQREETLAAARSCLPNGIIAECGDDSMVPNECGCPVAVNQNHAERIEAARSAYDSWNDSCAPPEKCALVDCVQATSESTCVSGSQADSICQWQ